MTQDKEKRTSFSRYFESKYGITYICMVRLIIFLIGCCCFGISGVQNLQAQELEAYVQLDRYLVPDQHLLSDSSEHTAKVNPTSFYQVVDVSIQMDAYQINYISEDGKYRGELALNFNLKSNNNIVDSITVDLNTIPIDSITDDRNDILYRKTIVLNQKWLKVEGLTLDLTISDKNLEQRNYYGQFNIEALKQEKNEISDLYAVSLAQQQIDLSEQHLFAKSGMILWPYPFKYYPTEVDQMLIYLESYPSEIETGDNYLIRYQIYRDGQLRKRVIQSDYQKLVANTIQPVFLQIPIDNINDGKYYLNVQMVSKENEVLTERSLFFYRSNEGMESDIHVDTQALTESFVSELETSQLATYLSGVFPIANQREQATINSLVAGSDTLAMQKYFLVFWVRRNPLNPRLGWMEYYKKMEIADYNYRSPIQRGWQTDRGRVYLQYGVANDVEKNREPGSRAYEIWQYYSLKDGQNNVKFVFINPNDINNDFELIHSNAIGELRNDRWQLELYNTFADPYNGNDIDRNQFNRDYFGGGSRNISRDF